MVLQPRRKPGPRNPEPRRKQRRKERQPPEGLSLRQWRRQKPKRSVPSLARKQRPLETVAEARNQIAEILRLRGGKQKFTALTGLLSRAYAGSRPNEEVVRLVSQARDKIAVKWPGEKTIAEKVPAESRAFPLKNVSDTTFIYVKRLKAQLANKHFKNCQNLIRILVNDTPKSESAIVAGFLYSRAIEQEIKFSKSKKKVPGFANTVAELYYAAGELYKKKGPAFREDSEKMFNNAELFRAKSKSGF